MIKKLLFLFLCLSTCIGSWAQFYKFTEAAQGHLYTAADEASVAETPKGGLCSESYFVKSDYTALTNPLPFTLADGELEFAVKDYYFNDGSSYTCAFGEAYVSTNTYATASATLITEANKSEYTEAVAVFTATAVNDVYHWNGETPYVSNRVSVTIGEPVNKDENYYFGNEYTTQTGATIIGWNNGQTASSIGFKSTIDIYTLTDGIYTKISASDKYGDGKDYYAVEFNDLAAEYTFPEGTFSASQVIESIAEGNTVYYYNGSSYAEVQVGDEYLGEGKYFKYEPGFTSKTPAELVALGYVKAVGAITEVSEDGKTLTILCSGDVCEPDDEFSTEGYKFAAKAVNTIYPGEVENSVKQDEIYNDNQEYYTRAQKYTGQDIPTTTKYQLAQSAYVNNGGRYDVVDAGTDINDGTGYFKNDNSESAVADMSENFEEKEVFSAGAVNYVYIWTDSWNNLGTKVQAGDSYNPDAQYVISTSGTDYESGNHAIVEKRALESYLESLRIVKSDPVLYTIEGTSYVPAAGTVYDEAKIYYSGVSFTTIDNIKENTDYATPFTYVNPGAIEYFVLNGGTYTKVNAGEAFDADQTYYVKDGFDYNAIAKADLINDSYMTSATVAENYWDALVNDINAAGYETVVFTTKEGDAENATICEHVTRAMMKTTTVNALDYQFVQIAKIEPTTSADATFAANTPNTCVTVLLLPEIRDAKMVNGVEHRHVPQACNNFKGLELVVMPNNATCIENAAFIRNSFAEGYGNYQLKTIVFNNTLKRIGAEAFKFHIGLNNLTFPASIEYIGAEAFDGGIKDVYFLGEKAPIVEKNAFSDKAYLCNNAIKDNDIDKDWYRVDRNAYVNGDYMAAMLHVPSGIAADKLAAYTDPTRHYHVFEWLPYEIEAKNVSSEEEAMLKYPQASSAETRNGKIYVKFDAIHSNDITKEVDGSDGQTRAMVYYCSGDAADAPISPSWGSAASGSNAYLDGGRVWGTDDWINGYNHHKSSGLYDLYAGTNYTWPCQANMNRGFAVASQGLLWNGKSTIADGINGTSAGVTGTVTATYDSDCDGTDDKSYTDGKEYMGLHEFILVSADVAPGTDTQEWDFNTIAGANWYTICVPVDMTVEEVRNTFGERTQVCKFNSISRDSNDKIKFGFTDEQCYGKTDLTAKAIVANQAYMIRPSKYDGADNKFTLPHYTIADQVIPQPTTLECQDVHDGNDNKKYTYTFIGNYNTQPDGTPIYMQKYTYYLGADSKNSQLHKLFIQTGETGKWKPYSCVIIPSDGEADYNTFFAPKSSKSTTCYFGLDAYEEEGNSVTQISEYKVVCGSENAPIYNLNGQFVGDNMSKLPQGIYVKNGKKFIVK